MSSDTLKQDILIELSEKIKNKPIPTDKDKESLQFKINKFLTEEDHLYIFTEILQTISHKIYTITENGTLFDLNDLDPETFWKMSYYTQMFINNHERQKDIKKVFQENDELIEKFNLNISSELAKIKDKMTETDINTENLSSYEQLRIDALKECQYSHYSKISHDKNHEKSIYSDHYPCKWKQTNKNDEIGKKMAKLSRKQNIDEESCDDEEDEEDIMINERDEMDSDELTIAADVNRLLQKPKVKLHLKQQPPYDDN